MMGLLPAPLPGSLLFFCFFVLVFGFVFFFARARLLLSSSVSARLLSRCHLVAVITVTVAPPQRAGCFITPFAIVFVVVLALVVSLLGAVFLILELCVRAH